VAVPLYGDNFLPGKSARESDCDAGSQTGSEKASSFIALGEAPQTLCLRYEHWVLDGAALGEKGSKGRNELDCIRGKGVRAVISGKESCQYARPQMRQSPICL